MPHHRTPEKNSYSPTPKWGERGGHETGEKEQGSRVGQKRRRSGRGDKERKVSKSQSHCGATRPNSAAESEAVAVLEHFRNTELPTPVATDGHKPTTYTFDASKQLSQLPALRGLANLLEKRRHQTEQRLAEAQQSPFQGQSVSLPQAAEAESRDARPLQMRTCFSESSAFGKSALTCQDKVALALLQSMAATNQQTNSQSAKDLVKPSSVGSLLHHNSAVSPLDKLVGWPNSYQPSLSSFNTYSSSTATDLAFDISAFLSHGSNKRMTAPLRMDNGNGGREAQGVVASQGRPVLAAFGSLIPNSTEGGVAPPLPAPSMHNQPVQPVIGDASILQIGAQANAALGPVDLHAKGFSAITSLGAEGQPVSKLKSRTSPLLESPDLQILEWIVGNRCLDANGSRGPEAQLLARHKDASLLSSAPLGRVQSESFKAAAENDSSTLRRPKAIRAGPKDSLNLQTTVSEGTLEALLPRMQPSASSTPSMVNLAQQGTPLAVAANDLGRVMQWAGVELAIRDQKVRDVERQRDEDRTAHDATLSAVAADVSRLKCGQAELVKAHRQYQEALIQKERTIKEKDGIISNLVEALQKSKKQYGTAAAKQESPGEESLQISSQCNDSN